MFKGLAQPTLFKEHPIVDITTCEPNEFDITAYNKMPHNFLVSGKFSLHDYCNSLLNKIYTLPKSSIKPFLQYQCSQLKDPFTWVNKVEKLIDLNRDLFITKDQQIKTDKALVVIELLRQEIESNNLRPRSFNFAELKSKVKTYQSYEDKMLLLMEARAEYLQTKPKQPDITEPSFEEKINIEIDLLKTKNKLGKTRSAVFVEEKSPKSPTSPTIGLSQKIQFNCQTNVFVDVFYQLTKENQIDGKPLLNVGFNELANFIANNFTDKNGKELSLDTVKTILNPARPEKRPNTQKRIKLNIK